MDKSKEKAKAEVDLVDTKETKEDAVLEWEWFFKPQRRERRPSARQLLALLRASLACRGERACMRPSRERMRVAAAARRGERSAD